MKHIPLALLAALTIGAGPITAEAATLTGDTVNVELSTGFGGSYGLQSSVVGAGDEGNYFNDQFYDFDGDANTFSILSSANFCGMSSCAGSGDIVSWALTSLDFGSALTGVTILSSIGGAVIDSFTADSVFFHWTEASIPEGTYFTLKFQTAAAVPLPAGLPLLLAGLGGLAMLRRRNTRAL